MAWWKIMNVWNYIYISFFNIRRKIIGHDCVDVYAVMLFVTSLDCLFYYGLITLIDGFTGYHLQNGNRLLFAILIIAWCMEVVSLSVLVIPAKTLHKLNYMLKVICCVRLYYTMMIRESRPVKLTFQYWSRGYSIGGHERTMYIALNCCKW